MSDYEICGVEIDKDRCQGSSNCLRSCFTYAIRIRNNKAVINHQLCTNCGDCINVCPNNAIKTKTTSFDNFSKYEYLIAIPSPVLYFHFGKGVMPGQIMMALKSLGFNEVHDLSYYCEIIYWIIRRYIAEYNGLRPLISTICPTIVKLIQIKFPQLIDYLLPIDAPREISAFHIKNQRSKELGIDPKKIGVIYISPCPSKLLSIISPLQKEKSNLDGGISIQDVYSPMLFSLPKFKEQENSNFKASGVGMSLDIVGGINFWESSGEFLSVSGIQNVVRIFQEILSGKLTDIELIDCYSCIEGCIGGSLTVENRYMTRRKALYIMNKLGFRDFPEREIWEPLYESGFFSFTEKPLPQIPNPFSTSITESIKKIKEREEIFSKLPRIDCGACGSPTCLTFAEDVVKGEVKIEDCPIYFNKLLLHKLGQKNSGIDNSPLNNNNKNDDINKKTKIFLSKEQK